MYFVTSKLSCCTSGIQLQLNIFNLASLIMHTTYLNNKAKQKNQTEVVFFFFLFFDCFLPSCWSCGSSRPPEQLEMAEGGGGGGGESVRGFTAP